jgi:metal-responsive CopG/Arc/MetJ family transcriptional regulator
MPAAKQINIRLPANLLEAIDAVTAELTPRGGRRERSDTIRILLWDAIERRREAATTRGAWTLSASSPRPVR